MSTNAACAAACACASAISVILAGDGGDWLIMFSEWGRK